MAEPGGTAPQPAASGGRRLRTAAVVPVRGHAALLEGALAALATQTRPLDEVIVVDDSPTPVLQLPPPVRVVTSRGAGPYAARNLGVAASSADVVLFLDARSRPRPGWVEETTARFADDAVGIVGSQTVVLGGESLAERASQVQQFSSLDKYLGNPFFLPYLPTCNLAVRRADFDAVGGFSSVRSGGDADLCWRLQRATGHHLVGVEDVLMEWVPRDGARQLLEQNYRYGKSHHRLRREWQDRGLAVVPPLPAWRLLARTGRAGLRFARSLPAGRDRRATQFVSLAGACYDWGYWVAHRRAARSPA